MKKSKDGATQAAKEGINDSKMISQSCRTIYAKCRNPRFPDDICHKCVYCPNACSTYLVLFPRYSSFVLPRRETVKA